jgi:hypothetical protein
MPDPVSGAVIGSSVLGAVSSKNAADTQASAANRAADISNAQYEQTRADQAPWRAAGETALNQLVPLATNYTPFGMDQFKQDPGYAFRLQEGLKQLGHQAGARGGLISGQTLKGMQDYAQNSASNEYTNAFNRYQTERNARLNPLQSLAGVGQSATNFVGQAGAQNASTMGNYLTGGAAAQAAGMVGGANALTGGLGTYLNYNQGNNLVSALRGGGGGMTSADVTAGMNPYFAGGAGTGSV